MEPIPSLSHRPMVVMLAALRPNPFARTAQAVLMTKLVLALTVGSRFMALLPTTLRFIASASRQRTELRRSGTLVTIMEVGLLDAQGAGLMRQLARSTSVL